MNNKLKITTKKHRYEFTFYRKNEEEKNWNLLDFKSDPDPLSRKRIRFIFKTLLRSMHAWIQRGMEAKSGLIAWKRFGLLPYIYLPSIYVSITLLIFFCVCTLRFKYCILCGQSSAANLKRPLDHFYEWKSCRMKKGPHVPDIEKTGSFKAGEKCVFSYLFYPLFAIIK